jgi:thiamine-monophosphate kinase
VLEVGGETLVLTHDTLVEGVHFLAGQDPADIAWKLVSVNLSDLAAKGARPLGVLLGYMTDGNEARFLEGLREALGHYGAPLLGGDTVSAPGPQVLGLTAIGRATHVPAPSRSGALPGDGLFVTGTLGGAMAGFEALQSGTGDSLAYRRPEARLAEGIALASHVSAMMDISDGLLLDALRMAHASGVTIAIESAAVPLCVPEARRDEALRWGDDYHLLFTASPTTVLPVSATRIGTVCNQGSHPLLLDGQPAKGKLGYEHG